MATHIKWKFPMLEHDYSVHAQLHDGLSLCGLAHEGEVGRNDQDFVKTNTKITCKQCIYLIKFCKRIEKPEY